MTIKEQIFELFEEIKNNQDRANDLLNKNITKIKKIIDGQSLNSSQLDIYIKWKIYCQEYELDYKSCIGGFFVDNQFINPIIDIVNELENN